MKSSYIVKILLATIIIAVFGLMACQSKTAKDPHAAHKQDQTYTCTMHPEVALDKEGNCPKCGMGLVEKKRDN